MTPRNQPPPESPAIHRVPVRTVTVDESHAGQRIDNFLKTFLKGVPPAHIYRCLRRGEVRVNKGRVRQHFRLRSGDVVRIPPLAVRSEPDRGGPSKGLRRAVADGVVHEDEGLLVLDKPAGIAVHGGSGVSFGVIEILRALRPDAPYLELVHRLDRETSGCLLVAKKRSVLRRLHADLRERRLGKEYLALVQGEWAAGRRVVSTSLRRNVLRSGERMVEVGDDGKPARTVFEPAGRGQSATLLRVRTRSGRTHQIRVHAASIGHPIAGDEKYGEPAFNRRLADAGLRRLFLHATRLEIPAPGSETALSVTAPLPPDLAAVLAHLELAPAEGADFGR